MADRPARFPPPLYIPLLFFFFTKGGASFFLFSYLSFLLCEFILTEASVSCISVSLSDGYVLGEFSFGVCVCLYYTHAPCNCMIPRKRKKEDGKSIRFIGRSTRLVGCVVNHPPARLLYHAVPSISLSPTFSYIP